MGKNGNEGVPTIADLYPELSAEDQADAEYRLKEYVRIVQSIWDRYEGEGRINELKREIKQERKRLKKK